ncbi:hypothetical protein [Hoeflea sp.]|uniref:hypothetical protein n=1 Tax=Hoeflea sp. TaxID=1940281 RepID=UPI003BAF08D8
MTAIDGPLSLPLSPLVADQVRASSSGIAAGRTDMPAEGAPVTGQVPLPEPVSSARTPVPFRLPVWPSPGAITLAQDLLDLSQTTFAYTATITMPETGPDFWDLLAAALPEPERE